jgi:hypothetical protein
VVVLEWKSIVLAAIVSSAPITGTHPCRFVWYVIMSNYVLVSLIKIYIFRITWEKLKFGPGSVCSDFFHYTFSLVIPSKLPVIISKVVKLFAFIFRLPKLKLKTKHYSQVSTGSILCSTYFYHRILTPHVSALLIPIKKMRRAFPVRYFQLINRKYFCFL